MKRHYVLLLLAGVMIVALAPAASAGPPYDGCGPGPGQGGATTIGSWERWGQSTYADAIESHFGDGAATAAAVFGKEDRNGDGLLCVMKQTLPNDSSGSSVWFVSHDNVAGP